MPGPFTPRKPTLSKAEMKRRRRVFFSALFAAAGDSDNGGGNGQLPLPETLPDYVLGVDYSSWVDPGGAAHRQATLTTPVTNLAPDGPDMTPHFSNNYPILHDGAWTGLATWDDIPDPNGETWFSVNPGPEDPAVSVNLTEWEQDLSALQIGPAHSMVIVAEHPLNQSGQLYRPLYGGDSVNRVEWNTGNGQILLRTPAFGPSVVATVGDMRGTWYVFGFARGQGTFKAWFNGNELTVGTVTGATGDMGFNLAGYGSAPDGGVGAIHVWMRENSPEEMDTQMAALALRFGISYGVS